MKVWGRIRKGAQRVVAGAGLCAVAALGVLATAPAASAADSSSYHPVISNMSWLNVGVRGGSTANGTDIIQWTADNRDDQRWWSFHYTGEPQPVTRLRNLGSGKCLTTDGVAGHPVFQQDCSSSNQYQAWQASYSWAYGGSVLYNKASGLVLDVQGASYNRGAEIDVWYPNGGLNQVFSMPGGAF